MSNVIRLPGLIDVHVHLREPGATYKEDFATGTKAAVSGGYTLVLDMPNNPVPTISPPALQEKMALAKGRIYSDVGFIFGASADSVQYFPDVSDKVFGLKVYMNQTTGQLLTQETKVLETVFFSWPKDKPVMVHAEGDTLQKAIDLAKKFDKRLHVCHISLNQEIELIQAARKKGLPISCEVTCHHLFLNEGDVQRLGPYGLMKPPLPSKADQAALWQSLSDGTIDMVASDHAPHAKEDKMAQKPAYGVPGLETTLPLLLTAVSDGRLTVKRLIELTHTNPKKIFRVPEQEDTFVEADTEEGYTISNDNLQTRCGWTPFAGMKVTGQIKKVVLRDKLVYDGKNIFGPYGQTSQPV